jgi:glycosyltransferase involved in cell wall biosynthesis
LPTHVVDEGVQVIRAAPGRKRLEQGSLMELLVHIHAAYRQASELLSQRSFDLIHSHFIVPSGLVAYRLYCKFGLPYVLTAHGSDVPGYNGERFRLLHLLIRYQWKEIVGNAAGIVAPSIFLRDLIRQQSEAPVEVIPNGLQTDWPPREGVRVNQVLAVSRIVKRKGIQDLIRAAAQLPPDWEVVVVGDGPYLPDLVSLAEDLGVAVRFVGHVSREAARRYYQSAKIFVLPSRQENAPMVLLEAMTAGCAVVTSTAPGCAEVVGDAGYCVETSNVGQLAAVLKRLTKDPRLLSRQQHKARQRSLDFSIGNIATQYERHFSEALAARQP